MIIEGKSRAAPRELAAHLLRTDTNEQVSILELRGSSADSLEQALCRMQALSSLTRGQKGLYHANIDPRRDCALSGDQWRQAADVLERELGLDGQPRAIVHHVKEGRAHIHVVWQRTDPERGKMRADSWSYLAHERAAQELERVFGHAPVKRKDRKRAKEEKLPDSSLSLAEWRQVERSGLDPKERKAEITGLWNAHPDARAFVQALGEAGYLLARGDQRGYVVLDRADEVHALARQIDGIKTKELARRLEAAGLPADRLPSVQELRAARQDGKGDAREAAHAPDNTKNPATARADDGRAESSGDREHPLDAHKTPVERVDGSGAVRDGDEDSRDGRAGSGASGGQSGGQGLPGQQLRPDGVVPSGAGSAGLDAPAPPAIGDHSPEDQAEPRARQAHRDEPEQRRDREAADDRQRQQQVKERRRVQRQADTLNRQAEGRLYPNRDRRQHTIATLARWGRRRPADLSTLTAKPARLLGAGLDRAGAMAAKLIDKAADAIDRLFGGRAKARHAAEPAQPAPPPTPESTLFSQWRDHGSPLADAIGGQDQPACAPEKAAQPAPEHEAQPRDPEAEKRAEIERQKREARERWEQSLRSRDDDDPRPRGWRR